LDGEAALGEHKLIWGSHTQILPVMPADGSTLEFEAWSNTQYDLVIIYAEFEVLMIKLND